MVLIARQQSINESSQEVKKFIKKYFERSTLKSFRKYKKEKNKCSKCKKEEGKIQQCLFTFRNINVLLKENFTLIHEI